MKSLITLEEVSIGYGSKVVANGISTSLAAGSLTCLIGCNGSGKSTLMRTMAAFQPALSGDIMAEWDGDSRVAISSMSPRERARFIGVVLTGRTDVQNMSVREMVGMGRMPYTGFWGGLSDDDRAIVEQAIDDTGIQSLADRMVQTLSDGERQKVMIAKALAQQTPLILLDEPTAFLDYSSKVDTMLMLRRLCHEQGKTVLISTHDLDVSLKYCDGIWMMKKGLLLTGTAESLITDIREFMRKDVSVNS